MAEIKCRKCNKLLLTFKPAKVSSSAFCCQLPPAGKMLKFSPEDEGVRFAPPGGETMICELGTDIYIFSDETEAKDFSKKRFEPLVALPGN